MVNYQNGKIYKLLLPDGFYYIGCTCNELKVRKQAHKNKSNEKGSENRKIYKHIKDNNMEWKDIHIVLYEEYPCKIKSELLIRESQILRLFCHDEFCLNIRVNTFFDGSSQEQRKISSTNYRVEHIELLTLKEKQKYIDNKEIFKISNQKYREEHKEQIKEYYVQNKEKINNARKEAMICVCGSQILKFSHSKHIKSKKHLKLLELN